MTDINKLFSDDPLNYTNENIDEIIAEMRKRRHLFKTGATPKPVSNKLTEKQSIAKKINIEGFKL